jgi:hypothetical protein
MNDPHVISLKFGVKTEKPISFNRPPAVNASTPSCDLTLVDNVLTVTFKEHHPTFASALEKIRDYLRAWEIQANLEAGTAYFKFEYQDAIVIDRNPSPPGSSTGHLAVVHASASFSATATCHLEKATYPDPPSKFVATSTVEHLWNRYQMYLDGRDLLTTMGYFCLSTIQNDAGGRKKASAKFNIHEDVLNKLGTLTSDVGDEATARKIDQSSTKRVHTSRELAWVETAAKKIIRRLGEHAHDPAASLPQITMTDLPQL